MAIQRKPVLVLLLALVLLPVAAVAPAMAASVPAVPYDPVTPGAWVTNEHLVWKPSPRGQLVSPGRQEAFALNGQVPANGFAYADLTLPAGLRIDEIHTLQFDMMIRSGGCGGGSPRFSLAIDLDGDGRSEGNLNAYAGPAPSFSGCALGAWTTEDLLDGARRFEGQQLGAGYGLTQAQAAAFAGPDHQVLSATLIFDSGWLVGSTDLWLDDIAVNEFTLSEPARDHMGSLRAGRGL